MVQRGYSVLYVGSAQWMGSESTYGCTQTSVTGGAVVDGGADGAADGGYDFTRLPTTMTFRLGFSTPTNYVNCQNFTAQGMPLPGEDAPRGIQVSPSQSVVAQLTVHLDPPCWESFAENSPVHWDQIAAQYVGAPGVPEAHTEDMKGVPFYAFTGSNGGLRFPDAIVRGTVLHSAGQRPDELQHAERAQDRDTRRATASTLTKALGSATTTTTSATRSRPRATSTPRASASSPASTLRPRAAPDHSASNGTTLEAVILGTDARRGSRTCEAVPTTTARRSSGRMRRLTAAVADSAVTARTRSSQDVK